MADGYKRFFTPSETLDKEGHVLTKKICGVMKPIIQEYVNGSFSSIELRNLINDEVDLLICEARIMRQREAKKQGA